MDSLRQRLGRGRPRVIMSVLLISWVASVIGYIVVLLQGSTNLDSQVVQWRVQLIVLQALAGTLMIVALLAWLAGKEGLGLKLAVRKCSASAAWLWLYHQ